MDAEPTDEELDMFLFFVTNASKSLLVCEKGSCVDGKCPNNTGESSTKKSSDPTLSKDLDYTVADASPTVLNSRLDNVDGDDKDPA